MLTISKKELAQKVRDLLKKEVRDFGLKLTIEVLDRRIRLEDGQYWHIPVRPSRQPKKTSDYYELLAEVETVLLEKDDLNVTLIPTLPK
jgi:hypothetical protein